MSETPLARRSRVACGLCGRDPARGYASRRGTRYCHGDWTRSLTCYERANDLIGVHYFPTPVDQFDLFDDAALAASLVAHRLDTERRDGSLLDRVRGLVKGRRLRGGRLGGIVRRYIPGQSGDQRHELVGERRHDNTPPR